MRNRFGLMLVLCVLMLGAAAWGAQQARPAPIAPAPIDDVLLAVRRDLQSTRADIIKKNVTLTPAQAAQFWPLFEAYQKEQDAILDEQLTGIQRYIESFDKLDDAGAMALINGHFERDTKMVVLRQRWMGQFRDTLGTKLAVRVMQIDRRLSLTQQLQFTTKIPLAH
jgi:Spy/CpxP family protein refolding chaperone